VPAVEDAKQNDGAPRMPVATEETMAVSQGNMADALSSPWWCRCYVWTRNLSNALRH
jgi:hypothetical protein